MEHCRFCQANLEPGAQRCSQCGQFQSTSLTDTPLQPAAPTPFLTLAAHSQDTLPDTPHSAVRVQGQESEPLDAQQPKNSIPSGAPTPLSTASVDSQDKPADTPIPQVPVPGKGLETSRTQERASEGQPGAPMGATETHTQQCLVCQKAFPAQAHFCPVCGHPVGQKAPLPDVKNVQEVTVTVATTQQEGTGVAAAQATPSAQQAPLNAQGTTAKQPGAAPPLAAVAEPESHSPEESATEAKAGEDKERGEEQKEEEEEEGPVAPFRKRRIAFTTLSRPLQVLLLLTLAQIGVVALLLVIQNLPQPQVSSGVIAEGQHFVVPLAAFIVLAVSLTAGTWFALAGALRVHWSVRFLVLALVTWTLASTPFTSLTTVTSLQGEPFVTETSVRWIQLALLALIWVGAAGVSLLRWRARRKSAVLSPDSRPWHGWLFGLAVVPILLYYGLELVIWRAYVIAGFPGAGSATFLYDIGSQTYLLPSFFFLLIYWSSTDLLEWSEIIAKSIVAAIQRVRVPWLLITVTALAAVGILVNELRLNGWGVLLGLALLAVTSLLVALVVRFARIRADWPAQIPPLALLLGASVLFLQYAVTDEVIGPLAVAHGLAVGVLEPLFLLMSVPVLLIALTIALVLVARGRIGRPNQGVIGLFLVMVTLLDLTTSLYAILDAAGLPTGILKQPYSLRGGLLFFAAGGALIWISSLLVRRRKLSEAAGLLPSLFLLLAGLQAISWLRDLANGINALGARSTVLLAGLFVLAALWDLATSGEQVTNTDSPAFPREGRILLYLGYTLAATSLLLYIGSLRAQTTGAPAPDYFSTDSDAFLGLFLLGSPMVVLTFLLRVGRRIPRPAGAAVPQPARRVSSRSMQLGIVGSGVLALALVMVFLIGSALPRLVHTSQVLLGQAAYTAVSPGPGCDTGGATWVVRPDAPISLRCLPTETRITALPGKTGFLGFIAPELSQAQNYRVSVQVNFSGPPSICVSIYTHSISYQNVVCANGLWELVRHSGNSPTILAQGSVALAGTYTLAATTDGPKQSLAINGIEKASVSDGTLTTGSIDLGVFNSANSTKSVVLSNFSFMPLPRSTSTATPPFSVSSSAVLVFRDPLTSPGRWKNQPANAYGTTCQFVKGGYQVQMTQKGWVDDCGGVGSRDYTNFVFEVHMKIVVGDCGGLDFRKTNQSSAGYYFLVCQNGTYRLLLVTRSGKTALIANGASPFISSGFRAENLIAVVANGANLSFYVNHQQIYGTNDSTYSHGLMDISAATVDSTLTRVVYWDASVWTL